MRSRSNANRTELPDIGKTKSESGCLFFDNVVRVSVARRDNGTFSVFRQRNVHDALSEMDLLPAKSEQFTAAHRGLYSEDDKLPQQWRSSPITRGEQALFFFIFETALAALWDARASNHLYRIAWQPEAPLPECYLDGVADRIEFAHDCRRSYVFETLIAVGRHICACEPGKRPVRNGPTYHRVDTCFLGVRAALDR